MTVPDHEEPDCFEAMNVALLKRGDPAEWERCSDKLWTVAITAARKFLYRNVFSDEDRADLAGQVILELVKDFRRVRLCRWKSEDDVVRWIWGRASSRAINLRKRRRRLDAFFDQPPSEDEGGDGHGGQRRVAGAAVVQEPIAHEARLDELFAWARLMPSGFSRTEEAAYRAVEVRGLTTEEYARELGRPAGTVGRYVWTARRKIKAVLELERRFY